MQWEQVYFESAGLSLAWHHYLTAGQPPYPAVIVLPRAHQPQREPRWIRSLLPGTRLGHFGLRLGHGESQGCLDAGVPHDISAATAYLRGRPEVDADRLAIRGSSMGGHYAIHAGATCPTLKAVSSSSPAPKLVWSEAFPTLTRRIIGCGKSLITCLSDATAIQLI